jgi:hypothetical protein
VLLASLESVLGSLNRAADAGIFLVLLLQQIEEEGDGEIIRDLHFSVDSVTMERWCEGCGVREKYDDFGGGYVVTLNPIGMNLELMIKAQLKVVRKKKWTNCGCTEELQRESYEKTKLPKYLNVRVAHGSLSTMDNQFDVPMSVDLGRHGTYNLVAGCIHRGYHYTAVVRETKDWMYYNDSHAGKIEERQVLQKISEGKGVIIIFEKDSDSQRVESGPSELTQEIPAAHADQVGNNKPTQIPSQNSPQKEGDHEVKDEEDAELNPDGPKHKRSGTSLPPNNSERKKKTTKNK